MTSRTTLGQAKLAPWVRGSAPETTPPDLGEGAKHRAGSGQSGQASNARRSFDTADALQPAEVVHPELPFLFLGPTQLDRWRGNALVHLGADEAISHLEALLDAMPAEFVRARGATYVDLALAYGAAGDREAAETYARQARRIISEVCSVRLRRRLERLVLPGASRLA
ncbi:tetratricopeptide repeat protein [Amycolatopsis minnesotensis]|uniref:Uncharacterized protein n=1 Tax=Amycolatopsis minnesotensis TaxID=337894 RepID=A0ABN2QHN2_9PSEU